MSLCIAQSVFEIDKISHNFQSIRVGSTSQSEVFVIKNVGDTPLIISGITNSGINQTEFIVTTTNSLPLSISPGNIETLEIVFTPTSTGLKSNSVIITHNSTDSPTTISLLGTGVLPIFNISHTSYNFNNVEVNNNSTQIFTITNTGSGDLTINSINFSGINSDNFFSERLNIIPSNLPWVINSGANEVFTVTFTPTTTGSYSANIIINHDAIGSPTNVPLLGIGVILYPPTNLQATRGDSRVNLSWDPPIVGYPGVNIVNYKVYRSEFPTTGFVEITSNISIVSNAAENWGLVNGSLYYYYITAVYTNPNVESQISRTVSIVPGTINHYVGDISSTEYDSTSFVSFGFPKSMSQTIYLASEVAPGMVYQMRVKFNSGAILPFPDNIISIYLGTTNMLQFNGTTPQSWIPFSQFTQVYNGELRTNSTGNYDVNIVFDTPFNYASGSGNLAVMVLKDEVSAFGSDNGFQFTRMTGQNRTIFWGHSTISPNPNTYPSIGSGLLEGVTNVNFEIYPTAGTITHPTRPSNWGTPNVGSSINPYIINSLANLRWMSESSPEWWIDNVTQVHFKQTTNIDATQSAYWNNGAGFRPIGHDASITASTTGNRLWFIGVYDGQNYQLENLRINQQNNIRFNGLFSNLSNSIIKDLNIVNGDYTITNTSSTYVGGFAGEIVGNTMIENCSFSGSIINNISGQNPYIGGIAGYVNASTIRLCNTSGVITNSGNGSYSGGITGYLYLSTIEESSSSCIITGSSLSTMNLYTAGIVGYSSGTAIANSSISKSYFNGTVNSTGTGPNYTGGIGGYVQYTSISNSYIHGEIFSNGGTVSCTGGIVGYVRYSNTSIINCYTMGKITNSSAISNTIQIGGIAGYVVSPVNINTCYAAISIITNESTSINSGVGAIAGVGGSNPQITNCLWDTDVTRINQSIGSGTAINTNTFGKTTQQMKQQYTYIDIGWSLTTIWEHDYNKNFGYAYLQDLPDVPFSYPPVSLSSNRNENTITLSWTIPQAGSSGTLSNYCIYRNNIFISTTNLLTYIDNDLEWDASYDYYVTAVYSNPNGESVSSNIISIFIPDNLLPVRNISTEIIMNDIIISWEAPGSRAWINYNVYRDNIWIIDTTDLFYRDVSPPKDTSYVYSVSANYDTGVSDFTFTTPVYIPIYNHPRSLQAVNGLESEVKLIWLKPNNQNFGEVSSYNIYRDNVSIFFGVNDTTFTDTGLANAVDYIYYVTAVYSFSDNSQMNGESSPSNTIVGRPEDNIVPPINVLAMLSDDDVVVSWENGQSILSFMDIDISRKNEMNKNADFAYFTNLNRALLGYNIYKNGVYITTTTELTYIDHNPLKDLIHSYSVSALYSSGESSLINTTILVPKYSPVRNFTSSIIGSVINLNWVIPESQNYGTVTNYKLSRNGVDLSLIPSTSFSYTDINITFNDFYEYAISAIYTNPGGESSQLITSLTTPLASPISALNVNVNTNLSGISLSWVAPSQSFGTIVGYRIFKNDDDLVSVTLPNYLDHSITYNTTYVYSIVVIYNNPNGVSEPISRSITTPIATPLNNFNVNINQSGVLLNWMPPIPSIGTIVGYRITRNEAFFDITQNANILDTSVNYSTMYDYSIVVMYNNPVGESESIVRSITTPIAPSVNPNTELNGNSIRLSWTAPNQNLGTIHRYRIYKNSFSDFFVYPPTTNYFDYNVSFNNTYNYSIIVEYINPAGESELATSQITTPTPNPIRNLVASTTASNILLQWQSPLSQNLGTRNSYNIHRNGTLLETINGSINTFSDNTIQYGSEYVYAIETIYIDPDGASALVSTTPIIIPSINPITNLQANFNNGNIILSWIPPSSSGFGSLTGYRITKNGTTLPIQTSSNYTDTNIDFNTIYNYSIVAVFNNPSGISTPATTEYTTPNPSQISNLQAIMVGANVVLTWSPPITNGFGTISNYIVQKNGLNIGSTTSLIYYDNDIDFVTNYEYSVFVSYSNPIGTSTPVFIEYTTHGPNTINNLEANLVGSSVLITWSEPSQGLGTVSNYIINKNGVHLNTTNSLNSIDYDIEFNTTYEYSVVASFINPIGLSQPSYVNYSTPLPSQISNLQSNVIDNVVYLSWVAPITDGFGTLSFYRILRNSVQIGTIENTNFVDNTAPFDTMLTYEVSAVFTNPNGESEPIEVTEILHIYTAPSSLNFEIIFSPLDPEVSAISLSWTPPISQNFGNVVNYRIQRDNVDLAIVNEFNYIDTTADTDTEYLYKVSALYDDPIGESTTIQTTAIIYIFNKPTDFVATYIGGNEVALSWNIPTQQNFGTVSAYKILRNSQEILTINTTSFTDDNVTTDTQYVYGVVAVYSNPIGESIPIESTVITYIFNPISNLISEVIDIEYITQIISLTWNAPITQTFGTVTGYKIIRNDIEFDTILDTIFLDYDVVPDYLYTYRVIAIYTNPVGVSIPEESSIFIPLYSPPINLVAEVDNRMVILNWNIPNTQNYGTITGYKVFRDGVSHVQLMSPQITEYTFAGLTNGVTYTFYITAIYTNPTGESDPSNAVSATPNVQSDNDIIVSYKNELLGNYPNPFNPITYIDYTINKSGIVVIDIYNVKGQKVKRIQNKHLENGYHRSIWNGRDDNGNMVSNGVYFYHMRTDDYQAIKKMTMIK